MKKIFYTALIMSVGLTLFGRGADEFGKVTTGGMRIPMFHRGRLQVFAYAEHGTRTPNGFKLNNAKLDLIKRDVDLDSIKRIDKTPLYKLGAPKNEVKNYWKQFPHSDGLISTPSATINRETRKAYGSEKIFFRSAFLDLNGIGFDSEFDSKIVNVHKDVVIYVRVDMAEKKSASLKTKPGSKKQGDVKITSDKMTINFMKNFVVVTGNVKVDDREYTLTCEKITLYMKQRNEKKEVKEDAKVGKIKVKMGSKDIPGFEGSGGNRELDRIVCDKKVVITRKQSKEDELRNGRQQVFADNLVYTFKDQKAVLSGGRPKIINGNDSIAGETISVWRNTERMLVEQNCVIKSLVRAGKKSKFSKVYTVVNCEEIDGELQKNTITLIGNVRVKDPMVDVQCHKIKVLLADKKDGSGSGKQNFAVRGTTPAMQGKKEVKEIICIGDAKILRKNIVEKSLEKLAGRKRQVLDDDSISGDRITIYMDSERLVSKGNSKIILTTSGSGGMGFDNKSAASKNKLQKSYKTVLTSDNADLNYGGNLLAFSGNVVLKDPRISLDCNKLEIFLLGGAKKAKNKEPKKISLENPDNLSLNSNKQVDKIVCTGNVRAKEARASVDCQYMKLLFQDRLNKTSGPGEDSLMSSGGREVTRVICRKDVHMLVKKQQKKTKKVADDSNNPLNQPAGDITVDCDNADLQLRKNYSELIGNVKVDEKRAKLECDKMEIYSMPTPKGLEPVEYEDGEVPEQITLGAGKDLKKIVCINNVVITRRDSNPETGGQDQKATCGFAVYDVKEQNVVMTKDDPTVSRGKDVVKAEKIFMWLDSGEIEMENPKVQDMELKQFAK